MRPTGTPGGVSSITDEKQKKKKTTQHHLQSTLKCLWTSLLAATEKTSGSTTLLKWDHLMLCAPKKAMTAKACDKKEGHADVANKGLHFSVQFVARAMPIATGHARDLTALLNTRPLL